MAWVDSIRVKKRVPRQRFVQVMLALIAASALIPSAWLSIAHAQLPDRLAASTATQPGATSRPGEAPAATYAERLEHEVGALRRSTVAIAIAAGVGVLLLAAVLFFARRAAKVKLLWGLFEFELPDELREARRRVDQLEREQQRQEEFMDDFYALAASLAQVAAEPSQEQIRRFLGLCAESAQRIIGSNKSSIWLHDGRANRLRIYVGQKLTTRTMRNFSLAPGEGFAGTIFVSGKPERLDDVSKHPTKYVKDPNSRQRISSMVGVPVWGSSDKIVGVLCASNVIGEVFTAEDEVLASFYADLAAAALHIAKLAQVALWEGLDYA